MKLKTLALSAAFVLVASAASAAMSVTNFTGTISVTVGGVTKTYTAGKDAAPVIPAGAEVAVVSGKADFKSGNVTVTANSGDSFAFSEGASGVGITGKSGAVTVAAGGASAKVSSGQGVAVQAGGRGATISVTAGTVPVTDAAGNTQSVATGKTAVVTTTTQPVVSQDAPAGESIETVEVVTVTVVATSSLQEQTVANCEAGVSSSSPCN